MWGYVLGAIGVGIALYELWTRPTKAEIAAAAAGASGPSSPLKPFNVGGPVRLNQAKAAQCGLKPQDWADADRWSADRMGPTLPVQQRLEYIRSMVAPALWPGSARRVYCYLIGPLPPTPGELVQEARPIQDALWPGY